MNDRLGEITMVDTSFDTTSTNTPPKAPAAQLTPQPKSPNQPISESSSTEHIPAAGAERHASAATQDCIDDALRENDSLPISDPKNVPQQDSVYATPPDTQDCETADEGAAAAQNAFPANKPKEQRPKLNRKTVVAIAIAACAVIILGIVLVHQYNTNQRISELSAQAESIESKWSDSYLDFDEMEKEIKDLQLQSDYSLLPENHKKDLSDIQSAMQAENKYYEIYKSCEEDYLKYSSEPDVYLSDANDLWPIEYFEDDVAGVPQESRFYEPLQTMLNNLKSKSSAAQKHAREERIAQAEKKDKLLIEEPGKTMYQVYMSGSTFSINGSYSGSGNFIVKLLDSNQNLDELLANEIGSFPLNKSVPVNEGQKYYLVIECSDGSWELSWSGTYGK